MACIDVIAKGISDSLRSAELVYANNKRVKNIFVMTEDAENGLKVVDTMMRDLALWESQLRRIKDAARACSKTVS